MNLKLIQDLRQITGLGLLEARNALQEANWDIHVAIDILRKKTGIIVDGRAHRETREGLIESYIHVGGKIGVLLEVNTETDFVARNVDFKDFVRNLCLQIAATNPLYVSKEDIPRNVIAEEEIIAESQCGDIPPAARAKFIGGKMERFYSTVCLLEQVYVKNRDKTVHMLLNELIAQTKENIRIRRFVRYQVGT